MAIVLTTWPIIVKMNPRTSNTDTDVPENGSGNDNSRPKRLDSGQKTCETIHSTMADPCAKLYAHPFEVRRNAPTDAYRVLYRAVT
jgi:hypothetical protein